MPDSGPTKNRGARDLFDVLAPAYEMLAPRERVCREVDAIAPAILGMGGESVLDAGCAAGLHAVELACRGFRVTGIDISAAMIREARARAASAPAQAQFLQADLSEAHEVEGVPFDAVVCLGNTMAAVGASLERIRVLRAFRRAMRPGGVLILQLRDLASIGPEGFSFPLRAWRRGGEEWILLRRLDRARQGIRFVSSLVHRLAPEAEWEMHVLDRTQPVVTAAGWREALTRAGLKRVRFAADLRGTPRRGGSAPDLVVFARS